MSVQEARARLDSYLAECFLHHEMPDVIRLRRLEDDLVSAGRMAERQDLGPF